MLFAKKETASPATQTAEDQLLASAEPGLDQERSLLAISHSLLAETPDAEASSNILLGELPTLTPEEKRTIVERLNHDLDQLVESIIVDQFHLIQAEWLIESLQKSNKRSEAELKKCQQLVSHLHRLLVDQKTSLIEDDTYLRSSGQRFQQMVEKTNVLEPDLEAVVESKSQLVDQQEAFLEQRTALSEVRQKLADQLRSTLTQERDFIRELAGLISQVQEQISTLETSIANYNHQIRELRRYVRTVKEELKKKIKEIIDKR